MGNMGTAMRTCMCGEVNSSMAGRDVSVCGWVKKNRNHGNLIFIDIRDISGIVQVFSNDSKISDMLADLRLEDVVNIKGIVRNRPENMVNKKMRTGEIEIECTSVMMLSKSQVPPFVVEDDVKASEDLRLKYRYLDLRRQTMQDILQKRSLTYQAVREYLSKHSFIEIETPIMSKSTPEGARDYLVPSRVHKGKFYALVQSPQLYKQILMVSGFDRYFQFARCFRDEDLRADRQPEHTQIDIEMSFVEKEDVFNIVEGMIKHVFKKVIDRDINIPFRIMDYETAMNNYGTDKPDLRFKNTLTDITRYARASESNILKDNEYTGAICFSEDFSRKEIDAYTEYVKSLGAGGMGYIKISEGKQSGPFAKFLDAGAFAGDASTVFIMSGNRRSTLGQLGLLRNHIAKHRGLIEPDIFEFAWITDFPLFEFNEEEKRYEPCHHMFTMPKKEFIGRITQDPLAVKGELYDLVCNGTELASGSIRIHDLQIQKEIMNVIGLTDEELNKKFGFLLEAFKYGAPPHGGIAPGVDRLIMLMLGHDNIRDVIAFPKTLNATGLMEECPSEVDAAQLRDLGIALEEK